MSRGRAASAAPAVKPPNETADPETARRTGDDDDLLQDVVLSGSNGAAFTQMIPPVARMVWPLIQAPSGPARKATAAAMSSGWPSRSSGASLAIRSMRSCGLPFRNRSVAVGPGATALTLMARPRHPKAQGKAKVEVDRVADHFGGEPIAGIAGDAGGVVMRPSYPPTTKPATPSRQVDGAEGPSWTAKRYL